MDVVLHVFVVGLLSTLAWWEWAHGFHMVGRRGYLYHYCGPMYKDGLVPVRPLLDVHFVFWIDRIMFPCDLCFISDAFISWLDDVSALTYAFLYDVV